MEEAGSQSHNPAVRMESLSGLVQAAASTPSAPALQALADAVRVLARSDAGRDSAGAEPGLVEALGAGLADSARAEAWPVVAAALANLAAEHDANRDAIAATGALRSLAAAVGTTPDFDRCAAAALGNIVAENGACQQAAIDSGCAAAVVALIAVADARPLALKAVQNFGSDAHILQPLVEAGVLAGLGQVVAEGCEGDVAASEGSVDAALGAMVRLVAALPAEAAPAALCKRDALRPLSAALRRGSESAQLGALALLPSAAPPTDADVAALENSGVARALCQTLSSEAPSLRVRLGAAAAAAALARTEAGGATLWASSAAAHLTAAVVGATRVINMESTTGQLLLDQAKLRLDCLGVLAGLANSEKRCLALLGLADDEEMAQAARHDRRQRLEGEPEPEPELDGDLAAACVAVTRHKHDLEGSSAAINILRNLALPAAPAVAPRLLAAGALQAFETALGHKSPNAAACAAAGLRILAAKSEGECDRLHTTSVAGLCFHNQWRCVAEGALAVCGRAPLLETVLGLDLEKTHPHCRVELARALALAEAAAVERCLSRPEGERDAACVAGVQLLAAEKGVGFISFLLLAPTPALCAHATSRLLRSCQPYWISRAPHAGGCLQADGGAGGAAGRAPSSRAGHRGSGRAAERGHDDCGHGATGAGAPGGNREWRGGRTGRGSYGAAKQSVKRIRVAVALSLPTMHCTRQATLGNSPP